MEYREATYQAY